MSMRRARAYVAPWPKQIMVSSLSVRSSVRKHVQDDTPTLSDQSDSSE